MQRPGLVNSSSSVLLPRFWKLSLKCASEGARCWFIETFNKYTASVVQYAQDHTQEYIRGTAKYLLVCHQIAGVKPLVVILQFGLNLPDEVFEHPVIQRLTDAYTDMIMLSNINFIILLLQ